MSLEELPYDLAGIDVMALFSQQSIYEHIANKAVLVLTPRPGMATAVDLIEHDLGS